MVSVAICVGINRYSDRSIPQLRYARQDARRFAVFLNSIGILGDDIALLSDGDATKSSVLRAIRVTPLRNYGQIDRVIVYFAGHGTSPQGTRSASSVLLACDSTREDFEGTGISFAELILAVNRLGPQEFLLIIDACYFDVGDTGGLSFLSDHDRALLDGLHRSCVMCLAAGALGTTKESDALRGGVFTHYVLKALTEVHHSESPSPGRLIDLLGHYQRDNPDLLVNYSRYFYATSDQWILDPRSAEATSPARRPIDRPEALAHIQGTLLSAGAEPIWFWGPSRSGKTTLFWQFRKRTASSVYISVDEADVLRTSLQEKLRSAASTQLGVAEGSWSEGFSLEALFDAISHEAPDAVIIADQGERLSVGILDDCAQLAENAGLRLIVIAQTAPLPGGRWKVVRFPSLTLSDVTRIIDNTGTSVIYHPAEVIQLASDNFVTAMDIVNGSSTVSSEHIAALVRDHSSAAAALVVSGGCCNVELFARHFSLEAVDVYALIEGGLANKFPAYVIPHDQLKKNVPERDLRSDGKSGPYWIAAQYWTDEISLFTSPFKAVRCVDSILACEQPEARFDIALAQAINLLFWDQQWAQLRRIWEWLRNRSSAQFWSRSLLAYLETVAERGDFAVVPQVLEILANAKLDKRAEETKGLCEARAAWWLGNYAWTRTLCGSITRHGEVENVDRARLEVGISYFFEGEWNSAKAHFESIGATDTRSYAWALMLRATIDGIRGIRIFECDRMFIQSLELLRLCKDWVGVGINQHNSAEIRWKTGDLRGALEILQACQDAVLRGGNQIEEMETCRNQLAAAMRYYGPRSKESEYFYQKLLDLRPDKQGLMQQMQVWNTLATFHAYRNDANACLQAVKAAHMHTSQNAEYHIYTLGNWALYSMLLDDREQMLNYVRSASDLAKRGENTLARWQIADDVKYIAQSAGWHDGDAIDFALKELRNG